jgi:hypothetical protein
VRRGGTIDVFGPYGTGHLVLALEILQRLSQDREAALVLVAGDDPETLQFDPRAVVIDDAVPGPNAAVLTSSPSDAARAFAAGAALAANLANDGVEVALVVADPVLASVGPDGLRRAAGIGARGAVTSFAVRTTGRGADLPSALGLDTTLVLSIEPFVLGIFPAVDPSALRSIFEPSPAAARALELLADARELRQWFGQSLFVAASYTGEPGTWADPAESAEELASILA